VACGLLSRECPWPTLTIRIKDKGKALREFISNRSGDTRPTRTHQAAALVALSTSPRITTTEIVCQLFDESFPFNLFLIRSSTRIRGWWLVT
jgi:hypothetical protein